MSETAEPDRTTNPEVAEPAKSGSAGAVLKRLLTLVLAVVVGLFIAWEAVTYGCYRLSVRDVQDRIQQAEADEAIKPLRLRHVEELLYGAPHIKHGSLGQLATVTYRWDGLLRTWGTMHLLYDREDSMLYIDELVTGTLPAAE